MSSASIKVRKFLESIKDKDLIEIVRLAEFEVDSIERRMGPHVKGAIKVREKESQYVAILKGFLFFMKSGITPGGVIDEDFELFRIVCENLVQKKQFKPSIMKYFNQK